MYLHTQPTPNQLVLLSSNTTTSPLTSSIAHPSLSNNLLINNVGTSKYDESSETLIKTKVTALNDDVIYSEFHTQSPLFFINKNIIKVPSKVQYALDRYTPKHLLREIHSDIEVAKEMCLIFLTQLNSTYFEKLNGNDNEGWKALKAEYLRELISFDSMAYKRITEALEYPLAKGAILECDHERVIGLKSYHYRLGENYITKGIKPYELKTKEAQDVMNKHNFRILSESNKNPICRNLIKMYAGVTLPTREQIIKEAKRLVKEGYKTKKGKTLCFLNKHPKNYYKHPEQRSFVEVAIEIFEFLTDNGLLPPKVGEEKSGGRVVDSLTLMPSWIRRLIKWNGKKLHECDFIALHPNIAISLYGGSMKYLKHGDLANELGIDVTAVKVEHLSLFNTTTYLMKQSPLYPYYLKNEPEMLKNITREKHSTKYKHKITSRRMFAKEVEIMTEVITELNKEGIYVLYVYDALLCPPKDTGRVLDVMDSVALKHGVYTTAKYTGDKKYNQLTADVKDSVLEKEIMDKLVKPDTLPTISWSELNISSTVKDEINQRLEAGELITKKEVNIDFGEGKPWKEFIYDYKDEINPQLKYVPESYVNGSLKF